MLAELPQMGVSGRKAPSAAALSGPQKAAIIVRLLLADGATPALSALPERVQTELALQLARMTPVDQATVDAVADEFIAAIDNVGLSFPRGLEGALNLLDGVISAGASSRVRMLSSVDYQGDPWEKIGAVDPERLVPLLECESVEIAAVILAKLKVAKAAELLGLISGERARRITYAISLTGSIAPETVRRIGISLADQLDTRPARAFSDGPVTRVGAILNYSPASVRDDVLSGLNDEDAAFADQVRRAIFTFANIRDRVSPRDVPRIQQAIEQDDLIVAIKVADGDDAKAVDFLLENISQRLAESMRADAKERPAVAKKDGEAAMVRIVNRIRALESAGDIFFVAEDG